MPKLCRAFIMTWQVHHPGWFFKLWNNGDITTEQFSNYDLIQGASRPAQKADIMRYEILYRHGGVYLDCDFECVRAITPIVSDLDAFVCNEEIDTSEFCSIGIMGSKPHHRVFERAVSLVRSATINTPDVNVQTGPYFFRRCFADGEIAVLPPEYFYPLKWYKDNRQRKLPASVYAIHHWARSWQTAGS